MYEDYVPWENDVPADLHSAIKHLREQFDTAHWNFGIPTSFLCYSHLHANEHDPFYEDYAKSLVQLKARVGMDAALRFNEMIAINTPAAVFKGFFDFYIEGTSVESLHIFKKMVGIGSANETRLTSTFLQWAESQAKHMIRSNIHQIDLWVRDVCDKKPYDPTEDSEEQTHWRKWQAPRFLIMRPSRYEPYDAARAWERVDAETSMRWRKMFYEHYVIHLESRLRNLAGSAAVELAMQPKTPTQSAAVTPLVQANQEYEAESRTHFPQRLTERGPAIGDTMANPTAEKWRVLREQFATLADEEKNEVAPGHDPYISASVVDGEGIREWMPTRRNSYRTARFEALAARASRLLGDAPEGRNLVDLWLECLFLDLLQQRKEGGKVTRLRFAQNPGDGAIIERVCEESATFCARLETTAYDRAVKLQSTKEAAPTVSNGRTEVTRKSLLTKIKNAPDGESFSSELAALALGVSRRTVQRKMKDQELTQGTKRGTVTATSLRRLLKLKRPTGASQRRLEPNQ